MGRSLVDLTADQRTEFAIWRARNRTIEESMELLYLAYPEARRYERKQFSRWVNAEGKEEFEKILAKTRSSAREDGLANTNSRLMLYVEVATKMAVTVRALSTTDDKFVPLSRELREYLKAIREERDKINMEDPDTRSAFELLMKRVEGTPFESVLMGSMQPTPGN